MNRKTCLRFSISLSMSLLIFSCVSKSAREMTTEHSKNSAAAHDSDVASSNRNPEPVSRTQVTLADISPEECVNYVQLKRESDFLCERADGSTRALHPGERRSTPLSREEIEKVISNNKEDSQNCFESVLNKDTKAEGKLYISFEIESDGKISKVTYNEGRSTYKNSKLGQCLSEKAKKWRFPVLRTDEILQVNYPFQLLSSEPTTPVADE